MFCRHIVHAITYYLSWKDENKTITKNTRDAFFKHESETQYQNFRHTETQTFKTDITQLKTDFLTKKVFSTNFNPNNTRIVSSPLQNYNYFVVA